MKKIAALASRQPLTFALVVTFLYILVLLIVSIPVSAVLPGETAGWFIGNTIGRLVAIFILLNLLARLGWLGPAGLNRLGTWRSWLVLPIPLAYAIAVSAYVMTGNLDFRPPDLPLAIIAATFLMVHALFEEIAFRGLVLHGLLRKWGDTEQGRIRSILVSTFFFGFMHILYLSGEPLTIVLLRMALAFTFGIFLGALVVSIRSIYPAAFFHGMLNLAGYLNLTRNGLEGTPTSWLVMSFMMLQLALASLYLLRGRAQRTVFSEAA